MREVVKRYFHQAAVGLGIQGREYTVDSSRTREGKHTTTVLGIYEGDHYIGAEGPYKSSFDMGLKIGRKRFWGRLEWITGNIMHAAGYYGFIEGASDIENKWWQFLLGAGAIFSGVILSRNGQQKKDIASAVIKKFS